MVSLADLGLLGLLLGLGLALRRYATSRFTPAMERFHGVVVALDAALLLSIGLADPLALRRIAPLAAILLLAGLWLLRWKELYPALYLALAASTIARAWHPGQTLWHVTAAALLVRPRLCRSRAWLATRASIDVASRVIEAVKEYLAAEGFLPLK